MKLAQQFETAALYLASETEKVTSRRNRILQMIREHGAVSATKRILAKNDLGDGFVEVVSLGRIDLTLEHLVATNTLFQSLFTSEEIRVAKQRVGIS